MKKLNTYILTLSSFMLIASLCNLTAEDISNLATEDISHVMSQEVKNSPNPIQREQGLMNQMNEEFSKVLLKLGIKSESEKEEFINSMTTYAKVYTILFWINRSGEFPLNINNFIKMLSFPYTKNPMVMEFGRQLSGAYQKGQNEGLLNKISPNDPDLERKVTIYSTIMNDLLQGKFGTAINNFMLNANHED